MFRRLDPSLALPVGVLVVADAVAWVAALYLATLARYGFEPDAFDPAGVYVIAGLAVALHLVHGFVRGLYLGRHRFGSFEETGAYMGGVVLVTAVLLVVDVLPSGPHFMPLSAVMAGAAYQLVIALGLRYVLRVTWEARRRSDHERSHRALIFGAGDAGFQVVRVLREDAESDAEPVGYLDDDPTKRNLRALGLRVEGTRHDIATAAERLRADLVVIALPSSSRADVAEIARHARDAGLAVRVLPPLAGLLRSGVVSRADIREFTLSDYLGREEVETDLDAIADYLGGKRVMITGAGGSIGSVLARIIRGYEPAALVLLDRDESALHAVQLELEGRALLDDENLVLVDIRDAAAVERAVAAHRPQVVFHAAALKHLTLLERFPHEAVRTNVLGTRNVLAAARAAGVERFVNVSTDKAADPSSVLGATKRLAELLTAGAASGGTGVYMSVRFGNVLGSRGSVIPTLRAQIAAGGPITITDPDVTRYFMTTEEAVQLVVHAGAAGRNGEVLVLDMGSPVRIVDLARQLIAEMRPGEDIPIEFTGLRPGEKLHEVLAAPAEEPERRVHPLITAFRVDPAPPHAVDRLAAAAPADVAAVMWDLVRAAPRPA